VNVPYSDEFRDRTTNNALLEQLAASVPEGGPPGVLLPALGESTKLEELLAADTFRHDLPQASSSQGIWQHLMLWACCLFFADVFIRRVQVSFAWVPRLGLRVWNAVLRRPREVAPAEHLERLRSRKAEVSQQIEQLKAAARFEAPPSTEDKPPEPLDILAPPIIAPPKPPAAAPGMGEPPKKEGESSYTERLLKAKKKAWEERKE
jgi:hypothetical protein